MKSELSAFDRRMEILSILMNRKLISYPELTSLFQVSYVTIFRDISALSRFAPISSKLGRYGGIFIVKEYKMKRMYLSREEEDLIKKLITNLSGKEKQLLHVVLCKFAMPEA